MEALVMSTPSPKQWRKKPRVTTVSAMLSETLPLSEAARLEMKDQPTKTPVSLLQELLIRRGITPKYELVQTEGQVHDPTFSYRVTVDKLAAIGSGRSKKEAKHVAAKAILDQLIRLDQPDGSAPNAAQNNLQEVANQIVSPYENSIPGNPIGTLQEMCMSRRWPPPAYIMEGAEGLPHERRFTIACTIYNHREIGTGKSKKLAKRQAAFRMWEKLRGSQDDPSNLRPTYGEEDGEEMSQLVSYVESRFAGLKDSKINTLKMPQSLKVTQFHQTIRGSTGPKLNELQTRSMSVPDFNYVQFLQEIAAEQEIEVTYVDVEERSVTGKFQILIQLSTLPVAVCYGCGATPKEAQAAAAHSTLEYLKILTKV